MTRDVVQQVRRRAQERCEYCHLPDSAAAVAIFHIEHIMAKQHGGSVSVANAADGGAEFTMQLPALPASASAASGSGAGGGGADDPGLARYAGIDFVHFEPATCHNIPCTARKGHCKPPHNRK